MEVMSCQKKKNWSQQKLWKEELFRAVAVNMSGIDWRKESGYQRQLGTRCAQDDGQVCLRGGAGQEMRDREKQSDFLLVDHWVGKVAFALTLKRSHQEINLEVGRVQLDNQRVGGSFYAYLIAYLFY